MKEVLDVNEFLSGYLLEAEEHLTSSTALLLSIEAPVSRAEATPRQVRELFRSLHTIKGLSAMVGIEPIVDIAHAMESVLRAADRGGGRLSEESVEALVKGIKAIDQRVRAVGKRRPVAAAPVALIEALTRIQASELSGEATPQEGLSLRPEIAEKLNVAERQQLLKGIRAGRRALQVEFVPSAEKAAAGTTITTVREQMGALGELVKILPWSVPADGSAPNGLKFVLLLLTDATDHAVAAAAGAAPEALLPILVASPTPLAVVADLDDEADDELKQRGVIRVEVSRLDDVLERLSALVVTQFRLGRAMHRLDDEGAAGVAGAGRAAGGAGRELSQIITENGRHLRDLRAAIMRARMVPVSEFLERVPLLVRGLGRATGKQVRLEIEGVRAELDKGVAERVFPAVVHLVRNAVDHALESPEERQQRGKPAEGLVRIACGQRSDNWLELEVSDDGRGVDGDAVARRAGQRRPETDEGLLALLTLPGLSTRQDVTTTSGRGLGMDIVKRIVVDDLGGELRMQTTAGTGTTFTLRIPLSITIVDAFSFFCGGQTFVVPVGMVEEIQELDVTKMVRGPDRRKSVRGPDRRAPGRSTAAILERRGEAVPVVALDEVFGLAGETTSAGAGSSEDAGAQGDETVPLRSRRKVGRKIIIVRRNGQPFAFVVDRMLGRQQVVVRPLQDPLVKVDGVPGSTDLGDGRPTLVLDLAALGGKLALATKGAGW